jgi:hypothetical protein
VKVIFGVFNLIKLESAFINCHAALSFISCHGASQHYPEQWSLGHAALFFINGHAALSFINRPMRARVISELFYKR